MFIAVICSINCRKAGIKLRTFALILTIVISVVGFSACERASQIIQPATPGTEDKSQKISIGVVLPVTGTGHLPFTGERMKQGMEFALDEINNAQPGDTRLKFIIEDDTSTPEGAVVAFNKLIHEHGVSLIIGPATSSATRAAFPVAQENQVVAISPTSSARGLSAIGDFVFRVPRATNIVTLQGVETTYAKLNYQRVATMYNETDFFSMDRDTALRETFTAIGVEVLTTEVFQSGDTDFSAQLTRIKTLEPDAIFVSVLPPEKPGILIQARELGISVPVIMSSLTSIDVEAAGAAAEGAITFIGWLSTDDTPGNQAFVQNYNMTYGTTPDIFAVASYTSVYILAEAIKNAQATDAISIRNALANIRDFDTVFGKFSFNADEDAIYEGKALIVKDGTLQPFE